MTIIDNTLNADGALIVGAGLAGLFTALKLAPRPVLAVSHGSRAQVLAAKLLRIPRPYLYAGILFFAVLGAYAAGLQALNIVILLLIGSLGYVARRYGFPVLPITANGK